MNTLVRTIRTATMQRLPGNHTRAAIDYGRVVALRGPLQSVIIPGLAPTTPPLSIGLWVYVTLITGSQRYISYRSITAGAYGGFEVHQNGSLNTIVLYAYSANNTITFNVQPSMPLPIATWNHLAVTITSTGASVYVNGTLAGSTNGTITFPTNQTLTLGRASWANSGGLTGLMEHFVYAPATWTASQISQLYIAGAVPASTTSELQFNERSGPECYDTKGRYPGIYSGDTSRHGHPAILPRRYASGGRLPVS